MRQATDTSLLVIKAPAKVNWFLLITGKRPDGFHEIQSLMQCVSLFDTLTFEPSEGITVETEAKIPMHENLIHKAAMLLKERTSAAGGVTIRLEKQIPMAAGLGGGSSDAASTLLGLNDLWNLGLNMDELMDLAAELGSDVPFFVRGGPALAGGRGELLEPCLNGPSCALALIKPDFGVSAGFAYSKLKNYTKPLAINKDLIKAITSGNVNEVIPLMKNDLEPPVEKAHPGIMRIRQALSGSGALASMMSGSGSTVFGVFHDEAEAESSIKAVKQAMDIDLWSAVVRTI